MERHEVTLLQKEKAKREGERKKDETGEGVRKPSSETGRRPEERRKSDTRKVSHASLKQWRRLGEATVHLVRQPSLKIIDAQRGWVIWCRSRVIDWDYHHPWEARSPALRAWAVRAVEAVFL
jgi:hypothetical protein